MKKKALKKLGLHRETLRSMNRRELDKVAGASFCPCSDSCDAGSDPTCFSCHSCTC